MIYSSTAAKRYGPQKAAEECDVICLVLNPVKAESFAAFQAKIIAQAAISISDWNFTNSGENLTVTVNAKSNIDPSGTAADADDLCVAVIDTVNQAVHYVQDVVDRVVTNETDDTINIPGLQLTIGELEVAP